MGKKILVVDDNRPNRELLRLILRTSGHSVSEAENGEEGIKAAREVLPNLIFMDIQLPVMDGIEAARQIKADPSTSRIPIIAFTSYAMKGDREKLLSLGFEGYVAKPIRIEEIQGLLAGLDAGKGDAQ